MIRIPLSPNKDLPSQLTNALAGRRIDLQAGKPDTAHLYTALAACWRNATAAAIELGNQLRLLQATPSATSDFRPGPVLQGLKTLIYAATETFDLYLQTIPDLLKRGRNRAEGKAIRDYKAGVKRLRDPVATMCNLMKHEHREIVAGRITSDATGQTTFIYRINAAYQGVQKADAEAHRDGRFASIERTLHEILHGLLRADYNAGELVLRLSEAHDQAIELRGLAGLGLASVIDDLSRHVPLVAGSEPNRFDGVAVEHDDVLLVRLVADKVPEPTTRTMLITVDEVARSVELFL